MQLIDRSVHPWVSFQLMIQIAPLNLEEIPNGFPKNFPWDSLETLLVNK